MPDISIASLIPKTGKLTTGEIVRLLEMDIQTGRYAEGAQLPTVRALAHQLGVNKNTVARAYQTLQQQGVVELRQGSGAFVRRRPEPTARLSDTERKAQLISLLHEAKQQGIGREAIIRELLYSVAQVFGKEDLKIAFVECNLRDIELLGNGLSDALGYKLHGLLLDDLLAAAKEMASRFDLIVTTFFHLSEVSHALEPIAHDKVIGVNAVPTQEGLLSIARLQARVVGLVCHWSDTINNLKHIIYTYHPTVTILAAQIEDPLHMQTLLDKADAIVVTRSCYRELMELKPKVTVIKIVFTIDQQSIDFLHQRMEAVFGQ